MAKVALAQFSGNTDVEANLRKIEAMVREAAASGANIICFPELCNTIYFPWEKTPDSFRLAEPESGPSVSRVRRLAQETAMMIVFPFYEDDHGTRYDSAVVIGPDGNIVGKYRKSSLGAFRQTSPDDDHFDAPPGDERYYFTLGNLGFPVFDTPFGVKLGILICYDRHFPEAARVLALGGADLVLIPAATHWQFVRDVWEIEMRAHAIANHYYVGAVNKVGRDAGTSNIAHFFGSAVFIDPMGAVMGRSGDQDDEILYAEIDPRYAQEVRDLWGFVRFRRPEAYGALVQEPVRA